MTQEHRDTDEEPEAFIVQFGPEDSLDPADPSFDQGAAADAAEGMIQPAQDTIGQEVEFLPVEVAAEPPEPPEPIRSRDIRGPMDSWVGIVRKVNYETAGGDPMTGAVVSIQVERAYPYYSTNNDPLLAASPMIAASPTPTMVTAWPFPLRHDQQKHVVDEGDAVTVVDGRDGWHYFLADDLPFLATIRAVSGMATDEAHNDGAGNDALTVRRQAITGDPDNGGYTGPQYSDLLDVDSVAIEYTKVLAKFAGGLHHGWRIGDLVWVEKRGRYFFVIQHRETFVAKIMDEGPDEEENFVNSRYWVKEQDITATWNTNSASFTFADRTASPRWVPAINLAEFSAGDSTHELATGAIVVIVVQADPVDDEPAYLIAGAGGGPHPLLGAVMHTDVVGEEIVAADKDKLIYGNETPKWAKLANPTANGAVLVYDVTGNDAGTRTQWLESAGSTDENKVVGIDANGDPKIDYVRFVDLA